MISTAEYNAIQAKAMSEETLLKMILKAARFYGWRTAHFRPGLTQRGTWRTAVQGDGKGFPDCVLVRAGRLIFAELKSANGKLTNEQKQWLDDLSVVYKYGFGVEVYIWRPSDYDKVLEILK